MAASFDLGREIALEREFDAPPEMVFQAWTEPEFLGWFFNPGMPVDQPIEVDLRVGGQWRQQMVINAETQYVTGGVYREILPYEKLVFTWGAVEGWPTLDLDRLDEGPLVTIRLTPKGARTHMDFLMQLPDSLSETVVREWMDSGMREGWGMTIDRLVAVYRKADMARAG